MNHLTKRLFCALFALVLMLTFAVSVMPAKAATASIVTEEEIDPNRLLYTFTADDFRLPYAPDNGDCVMEDPDSTTGKAAVLSYAKRKELGDKGMINAMIRGGDQTLTLYSQGNPYVEVGSITIAQLKDNSAKGGYTIYEFTNIDLMPGDGDYFLYLFDCWGFQVRFTDEQKAVLREKTVDVYLSLKITGNVNDNENNTPTYYIDKIMILESDPNAVHKHSYSGWTVDSEKHIRSCTECGEIEKGAHNFDNGVVTKEATATEDGAKVYTCQDCGKTKTIVLSSFNSAQNNQSGSSSLDVGTIIAVALVVVAVGIVVAALLLMRKKKDQ